MNTIKRKINLLTKTFWTYKDIAEFYEISYKTAIKEKKDALLQLQKESDDIEGITKYNSELINIDIMVDYVEKEKRIEKIKQFKELLDQIENRKGNKNDWRKNRDFK